MVLRSVVAKPDPNTGEVSLREVTALPTHFKCPQSGAALPVENPEVWVYQDDINDFQEPYEYASTSWQICCQLHPILTDVGRLANTANWNTKLINVLLRCRQFGKLATLPICQLTQCVVFIQHTTMTNCRGTPSPEGVCLGSSKVTTISVFLS